MAKLVIATRYLFACSPTMVALTAVAYWILWPAEWRSELLSLLAKSFSAFTRSFGTNNRGWFWSEISLPILLTLVTSTLIRIFRGRGAMSRYCRETALVGILAPIAVNVLLCPLYIRNVVRAVYDDHQSLLSKNARLAQENEGLLGETNLWKHRVLNIESDRPQPTVLSEAEAAKKLARALHVGASNVLDFQAEELNNRPMLVLIAVPGGSELMRENNDKINRYDQEALLDFLKRFGGPIDGLIR
jgi:hypothetical protein